jgi:signal transduction histidine kinase
LDDLLAGPEQEKSKETRPQPVVATAVSPTITAAPPQTLADKVAGMLAQFNQQTGIAVECRLEALEAPLPSQISLLIQKTVSACLKNVYRHAQATIVGVSFNRDGRFLQGSIADNGVGFDMSQPPTTKALAQYQAEYTTLGGSLEVIGYQGQGAKINFRLPIQD